MLYCCWLLQAEPTPQCPCLLEPSTGYGERGIRPEQGDTDHHGHRLAGHGGLQPVFEVHSHTHILVILHVTSCILIHICQSPLSSVVSRLVDMILKTEKNCVAALLVKADSLFNLCLFERALVLYHR